MPVLNGEPSEIEGLLQTAKIMLISARTAPKSSGIDDILTAIVFGEDKEALALEMDKIADERGIAGFKRDSKNLRNSSATVLIGVRGTKSLGLNCGACGYNNCSEFDETTKDAGQDFTGPNCVFKSLDLGIAIASASKTASTLNVDNRIMYRVGTAAKRLHLLPEATVIIGIPISAKGKNIYFDRPVQ
jgi:uncharacterized ferredoxin-like protein